jgi:hypothetical protein
MAVRCPDVAKALETSVAAAVDAVAGAKVTAVVVAGAAIRAVAVAVVVVVVIPVAAEAEEGEVEATVAAVLDSPQATAYRFSYLERLDTQFSAFKSRVIKSRTAWRTSLFS